MGSISKSVNAHCQSMGFREIAAATIEERLRLYGSKTRCFCPGVSKATRIKASLSSPSESNHAPSAFLTVFHHTAIAKQGTRQSRAASMFEQGELRSRREEWMENGVKNLRGARLFLKTFSNNGNGDAYMNISFFTVLWACFTLYLCVSSSKRLIHKLF